LPAGDAEQIRHLCVHALLGQHTVHGGFQPCGCRKHDPRWSGGFLVFVEESADSAESVVSADGEMCQSGRFGDRFGQRLLRPGVRDAAMWAVLVVVVFVLAQGVQ
jgi:hypothetical protein